MKSFVLPFLLFFVFANSQNLDQYKYAVVKSKFDFQSEANQYRLNNLAKAFLEKYNFEVYFDTDILPEELANNQCQAAFFEIADNSALFKTKVNVVIRNCRNEIIYTSPDGTSNKKSYSLAYNNSVRQALELAMMLKEHKFNGNAIKPQTTIVSKPVGENKPQSDYQVVKLADGYSIESPLLKSPIRLFKTSNPESFIAKWHKINGTATVKDGFLLLEYYENGQLKTTRLTVTLDQ